MESWINNFINWIPIGGVYYSLLGLVAFFESLAFIGILFPGSVLIIFTGFLSANGKGDFVILAIVYSVGAIAGDLISYLLGARAGGAIMQKPWFKSHENLLQKAQLYFAAHGGKSVFIGRFVGFLRPFIPFIAGSARMNPIAFSLYAIVSGILWGISYPGLGYLFGASWQMAQVWSGRFSLLILLLAILFILNALFWKYLIPWLGKLGRLTAKKITVVSHNLLATSAFQSLKNSCPRLWNFIGQRFTTEHECGIFLTVGLTFSAVFAALFAWFGRGIHLSNSLSSFDQRLYEHLSVLHHPWTDFFFAIITWIGSSQALIIIGAFVLFALIINNRDFSALALFLGLAGGVFFTAFVKTLISRPRPIPLFPELTTIGDSFPSGHAFSALLFYGLIVYFLIGTTSNWRAKFLLILFGSFIALLVGFSRIYLGVHWSSDVLAGFSLAGLWLTFIITLCETRFRYGGFFLQKGWRPFNFSLRTRLILLIPAAILTIIMIGIFIGPYLRSISFERTTREHQIIELPFIDTQQTMTLDLPRTTQSLWGEPHRSLSLIVIADETALQQQLKSAGWRPAAQVGLSGFKNLLGSLVMKRPLNEATIVPQLVDGQLQDFSFVRTDRNNHSSNLDALLIWDLGRRIADGRTVWGLLSLRQIGVKHLYTLPLPIPINAPDSQEEKDQLANLFYSQTELGKIILINPSTQKLLFTKRD